MHRTAHRPPWRPTTWDVVRAPVLVAVTAVAVLVAGCDGPARDGASPLTSPTTGPAAGGPTIPTTASESVALLSVAQASDEALPSGLPNVLLLPADYEILAASEVGTSSLLVVDAGPGGMAVFDANSAMLVVRGWMLDREVLTDDVRTLVAVKDDLQVSLSAIAADGVRLTYQVQPAP